MEDIYDLIVIGGGPSGLTAGIYAGRSQMKTLIIEKNSECGGQIRITAEVANYPGFIQTSGSELTKEMKKQAENFGVEFKSGEVTEVNFTKDIKVVKVGNTEYKSLGVIIATGASPRSLGFPGEDEFRGRGVGYCATCDGQFFKGKDVFVVGAGFAAAEEAIFLTRYAKKVYVIAREPEFTCAKSIADHVLSNEKIEVMFNTEMVYIKGDTALRSAKLINNVTKKETEYKVENPGDCFGVFVFVGYVPMSQVFQGHITLDPYGYIPTKESLETDVEGIYAAGDIRPKQLRQLVTATSDGAIAATNAERFIKLKREKLNIKISNTQTHESSETKKEFFSEDIKTQLLPILDRFEKNISIVAVLDDRSVSKELSGFLEEFSQFTDKVSVETYSSGENVNIEKDINATMFPVMAIMDSDNKYTGIKFCGIPSGHEFNSFVLALYNISSCGQKVSDEVDNKIMALNKPIKIQICVSLTCTMCPDVVMGSQLISSKNHNVESEMIDIMHFEQLQSKHSIMSVPAMIINENKVVFGKKNIDEILEILHSI